MKKINDIESIELTGHILYSETQFEKFIEEPCIEACKDLYYKNIITVQSSANKNNIGDYGYITFDTKTLDKENTKIINKLSNDKDKNTILIDDKKIIITKDDAISSIRVPIKADDMIKDISNSFLSVTKMFKKQDILTGKISFESFAEELFLNAGKIAEGKIPYFRNTKTMEEILKKYEIFSCSYFPPEDLCFSVEQALKFYEKLGPKNGVKFVKEIIEIANNFNIFDCFYDSNEDCFWYHKSFYERHMSYIKNKKSSQLKRNEN